jgi:hypothetical protein
MRRAMPCPVSLLRSPDHDERLCNSPRRRGSRPLAPSHRHPRGDGYLVRKPWWTAPIVTGGSALWWAAYLVDRAIAAFMG